jgi:hypothetical protein
LGRKFCRKVSADSKNCRKQLPTKVLAGNLNPQEIPQIICRFKKYYCQKIIAIKR